MPSTLQSRRAALAREAILDALVAHLEAGDIDAVAMEDLAAEAGVSRRTLYRYFPTRADLIAAAGDWLRGTVFKIDPKIAEGGIAESFRLGAARMQTRPKLARALLATESGRAVRGSFRGARAEAIRREVRAKAPGLSRRDAERGAAVLTYLCSLTAWVSLQDESGLAPERAEQAVLWAIETIEKELQREGRGRTAR
jgi:AcrR family transcriptional regulator